MPDGPWSGRLPRDRRPSRSADSMAGDAAAREPFVLQHPADRGPERSPAAGIDAARIDGRGRPLIAETDTLGFLLPGFISCLIAAAVLGIAIVEIRSASALRQRMREEVLRNFAASRRRR